MSLGPSLFQEPAAAGARAHLVAYSGGLDSTVLLHLAATARLPGLMVVHVHHGLQESADAWAAHCAEVCTALALPFVVERVTVDPDGPQGPESAARTARYAALAQRLPEDGLLLTAHHLQDQSETLLLRLLRGTGIEGLAAMRAFTPFASGQLWRPLLETSREELRRYAEAQGLRWIEDPHNSEPRYLRSWLRSEVLPLLRERQPAVDALLARTARHAAEAVSVLQEVAADDYAAVWCSDGSLSIAALTALAPARREGVIRHWLKIQNLPLPSALTLQLLEPEVFNAREDAEPLLGWPGGEFRRYRDWLYVSPPLPEPPADWRVRWSGRQPLPLPAGCGSLSVTRPPEQSLELELRFAAGGERLKPRGFAHHRTLKQLCQEAGIPPWLRRRMPLAYQGGELVSVAGVWAVADAPPLQWDAAGLPGKALLSGH